MLNNQDEDEKKKREQEAQNIIASLNPENGFNIQTQNENEKTYLDRINEANSIINSINPREEKTISEPTQEEIQESRKNTQDFLNLIDGNVNTQTVQEQTDSNNYYQRKNQMKTEDEIKQQAQQAKVQGTNVPNQNQEIMDKDVKVSLANPDDIQNAQTLRSIDVKAMEESSKKNENIKKGGFDKFNEAISTVLDNIYGGAKQTVSGLVNILTSAVGFGVRGLEGAAKIVGLDEQAESLNNAYDSIIDTGSSLNKKANYERTVTSQINDDLIKTTGDVTNTISNMLSSYVIGYIAPVSSTAVMGLSAGGNAAQEVLDENKDNIGQATLTGIAKGYSSYLTEKMFDANILTRGTKKSSIQEGVNRLIASKINSEFGKEFANRTVGIIGENIEEIVDNNAGYLIDKLINNKELPDFQQWFDEQTETVKTTTLSTIIMSLLGLGGTSFKDIEGNINAQYWIDQAQQIIDQENLSIHFNPTEVKNINNTNDFYITRFTPDGEISNIVPTKGKTIYNSKSELNVSPVIILDSETNMYNVIDGNTGVVLDSTPYSTTMEAEGGFNEKISKLSDLQVKDINTKISKADYMITNEIMNVVTQAQEQLSQMTLSDYGINTRQNTEQNYQQERQKQNFESINKTINQISDKSVYNQTAVNNLLNIVSNNIKNIEYIQEDNGRGTLYSFDNDKNITGQQSINNRPYAGKKIKSIVNTAIQNADILNLYQDINANNTQTSSEQNIGNSSSNATNYAVQDINRVAEPFNKQESYTRDEMAEIWNNEISNNNYDAYYDSNGNIERYIAIEEDGNNIVVNQYDNNDNVVKSEVIPSENGRYRASDIQNTINRVTSLYDENRPIKGQQDIEDNKVKSMKKNKKETSHAIAQQKLSKVLSEKSPNTRITQNKKGIQEDIENFSNQVDEVLDGTFPKNSMLILLKETPKPLQDIGLPNLPITITQRHLNTIINESGKDTNANYHGISVEIIKQLPEAINTPLDILQSNTRSDSIVLTTYLADKNDNTIIASIKINGKGTINDIRIDTNVMTSAYGKDNYEKFMERNIQNGNLLYDIDRGVIKKVDRARLQLPRTTDNRVTGARFQLPGSNNSTTKNNGSNSNNIIPPTSKIVKNDKNVTTKQSMQNNKNNTSKAINSLNDIKTKYKNQTDQLNIFENKDNTISINNLVVKQNLRNKGIGQNILDDIISYADKNNKTITLTPTSEYLTKNRLTNWYKRNGFVENKGRNTNYSISDTMYKLPKISNNDGIRAMKQNASRSSTTQTNTTVDNQGRTLSKQQQEYFKNSKVRDNNGNLLTVYHGTDKAFTEFKNKYIQHGRAIIDGFYLTTDRTNANEYGNNIMELYVNIENPLYLHNYNGVTRELIERGYANNIDELITKYNLETDDSGIVPTAKALTKLVKKLGYDGIITTTEDNDIIDTDWSATQIVVLNSNQIKNIDNTNPTSDKDIRFAKKTVKPVDEVLEPGQRNAERETNYIEQEIRKIEQTGNWDDSIPVTKMTDIRKTIEDYLGIGVQKGRFRQQAYGIYKGTRDVIRTKELKDMDTILHETGHALDIGNRIKINKESISNELLKAVDNYGGYEAETREIQLEEGFAEVIREYTIVPEQARIDYPQTVSVLEGIRQENKDFDNFIKNVQEQTYNYIHQNPRNRGGLSNQSIGERTDKMPLTPESIRQTIIENVWDSNYPLKRAVQVLQEKSGSKELRASDNAYLLTRLASGIGDKVTSMLSNGYIDENGNRLFPGLSQLGEVLENNTERFNDLRAYLVAQRDLEYKDKGLKTGIRTNDSKAIIEQFKNDAQIQEASKIIYNTLDGVLQYAVNNKLITPENAQTLRESNVFYVPMQRVIGTNGNNVGRKGAVADIIKSRTGSELDIKDVLENIVANSANIIQQVENNKIINALYTQGENAGLTGSVYDEIDPPMKKVGVARLDVWQNELKNQGVDIEKIDFDKTMDIFVPNNNIDEKNQIVSFIDNRGQRRYLQFKDELLFKTLTGLNRESMSRVLSFCETLNKPLRYGATLANLGFALPNMLSDTVQASIYSEAGFVPFIDTAIGALDVLASQNQSVRNFINKFAPQYAERVNTMYELYLQSGSTSSTKIGQERKSAQRLMKDIYGTKNIEILGIPENFKPLKRMLDVMTYIPELSEQSTRFRVFEKNLEYYRRNGMNEIDARMEAAIQARDATQDFSRMGTTMREVNKVIPFSAARVGSIYTFTEKMKANPKRTSARIAVMLALNMLIKGFTANDDEIQELNQRKKDDNFVFKIGEQVITIKKPQGFLRSLINFNDYIIDLVNGNIDEGKEGERLKDWLFNAIMDNSVADDITGMVPSAITPILENAINKDLYYNSDIVKNYDLDLPDSEQYYDYNSQLAIWLGQIFNYSPAKIDNFISGYFAGLGTQVTNIIDWIVSKTGITPEEPDMGLENNSIGKRFFVNVNSNSASVDEVYDLKTELTKKKNGGTITAKEEQQLEDVTNATSEMAKLNKQIKEIKKDLTMSGEEKAEQIKLLQQQKTDTARQALGKEVLYSENETNIESTTFYPSRDTLSQNGYTLNLTADMKKEYEELAYNKYKEYENQGLYSEEKLESLREKCKDYAKSQLLKKYKDDLIKKSE